jgi:hypothetical protein
MRVLHKQRPPRTQPDVTAVSTACAMETAEFEIECSKQASSSKHLPVVPAHYSQAFAQYELTSA